MAKDKKKSTRAKSGTNQADKSAKLRSSEEGLVINEIPAGELPDFHILCEAEYPTS